MTPSTRRTTVARTMASRIGPARPCSGLSPSPNGGTPGARSGGVYGEKHAHGVTPDSAADRAPQQFTSTSNASGSIPRYRIGEIGDFVRRAPAERRDRQLQRGNRIGCLPVIELDVLDPRIDRVSGEAELLPISTPMESVRTWTCGHGWTALTAAH